MREFQQSGFRSGPQFIRKSFFGGRGGLLFGGLFFLGSLVGPALLRSAGQRLPEKGTLFRSLGRTVGKVLAGAKKTDGQQTRQQQTSTTDVIYVTPLSPEELHAGKTIQVQTDGPGGPEMLKVSIPPGSRPGQRLRLRGKGRPGPAGRGDLYLHLELREH
jgi:DnaJ-class molecular chaperone